MIWLGIAVGTGLLLIVLIGVLVRGHAWDPVDAADVDPLFTLGIALTAVGVALATTVGSIMYAVMTAGLIVMAMGAYRTRHHGHG